MGLLQALEGYKLDMWPSWVLSVELGLLLNRHTGESLHLRR